jgi:hypothetical protein
MIDPKTNLPRLEEFDSWMAVEDLRLARRGIPIPLRALELWPLLQRRYGIDEALGPNFMNPSESASPLLDMARDWYLRTWGERTKNRRPLQRVPVMSRGEIFEYAIPVFLGAGHEPVLLSDYLTGATPDLIRVLTDEERARLRTAFEQAPKLLCDSESRFVYGRVDKVKSIHRLRIRCVGDRELAMDALVGQVDLAAGAFWSREYAEKAMKIFLFMRMDMGMDRLKLEIRHDLLKALDLCLQCEASFDEVRSAVSRLVKIKSDIRFHSKPPSAQEACDIHWDSLLVAAHCGLRLEASGSA